MLELNVLSELFKLYLERLTWLLLAMAYSPYYNIIGTILWNDLSKEIQSKENVYEFKKEIK